MLITGTNQNVLALQCEQLKCRDVFGRSFPNSMDFTNEYKSHNSNNQDSCFQASGIGHVTQRLKPATKRPKPNVKQGLSALFRCPWSSPKSLSNPKKTQICCLTRLVCTKKNLWIASLSLYAGRKRWCSWKLPTNSKSMNQEPFYRNGPNPPGPKENEHDNGKDKHLKMSPIENDDIPLSCPPGNCRLCWPLTFFGTQV